MSEQLIELMLQLKKTTPAAAKQILNSQPQIAYALMTLMVSMNAVNFEVFQVYTVWSQISLLHFSNLL